jgi:hypothetical protein
MIPANRMMFFVFISSFTVDKREASYRGLTIGWKRERVKRGLVIPAEAGI